MDADRAAQNAKFGVIRCRAKPSTIKPYIAPQFASEGLVLGEEEGKEFEGQATLHHLGQ